LKTVVAIIAIIAVFFLDYLPMETGIAVYAIIGVTIGAFSTKANRWARNGLVNVVGGAIIAILIGEVLPSVVDDAVSQLDGLTAFLVKSIPFILRAAMIWYAIDELLKKLGKIRWR